MAEALREVLAAALHETRGLLAGDVLLFEDCLTLADSVLALGDTSEHWGIRSRDYGSGHGWESYCRDREDAERRAKERDAVPYETLHFALSVSTPLSTSPKDGTPDA